MLLTRILRRLRRDEQGAALAAVVGLMATSLLLTTVIAASVISTSTYTSTVRADVQAQAAAEAGVAAARAGLVNTTCLLLNSRYESAAGATPRYVATVWIPVAGVWVRGCPVGTSTQVRILSTGYASSVGVAGASGEDSASIEVILGSVSSSTTIQASGPAIYSYSANNFGGSGVLTGVNGSQPSVMVKTGNLDCGGAGSGTMSLVVDSGNLEIGGSCNISGSAWASGSITHDGGATVGGNLIGNGVALGGSSRVGGSVWSTGAFTMDGAPSVGGNVTAASMNIQGTITGNAWIYGASVFRNSSSVNNITTRTLSTPNNSYIRGTRTVTNPNTPGASPYATPARPVVPGWVDFNYDRSKWVGFTEVVLTSSQCSYESVQAKLVLTGTSSVLLDARSCSNFELSSWQALTINGDLAIVANKINLGGSGSITSTGERDVWLINPDTVANGLPDCGSGQQFSIGGAFSFSSNISVMMYSPCRIEVGSSTNVRGQIFGGQASVAGAARIGFVAIGLPGVDLNTGTTSTSGGSEANRTVVSSRNVTTGN